MNRVIAETTALPLYGQIAIQDVGTSDIPDWATGEESAVASKHAILIATQPDHEGEVRISVLEGDDPTDLGEVVYNDRLLLTSTRMQVGSDLAGTITEVDIGRQGYLPLSVYVDPLEQPRRVAILIRMK